MNEPGIKRNHELQTIDEVRMVAAFAQFHHRIHQVWQVRGRAALRQEREVAFENCPVIFLLYVGQFDFDDRLLLRRKSLLDVLFQTPQHHRLQQLATDEESICCKDERKEMPMTI